ncbi:small subunit processome component 20 homolog [Ostrinia furnacalis]|uniref:small subunit processome component 20 homolog n=1 Tax=Ostrinia furnacalis TaxID=93504 RepID=UPI00103C169A|nr:small subunit processome component 20 homolog [Ostrinia furnacalis]
MKSKPVKHKTTNTFRFVPFAERINSIDIRHAALYHIEHAYTQHPDENDTHFHLAIQKWYALNLTENFKKFRKEVFGIITVPQLVHKKEEVFDILERYLNLEDQLCLQPLLEILVSLAKDLRNDFYPQFPRFLDILIKLLNTKDADRLEWTLVCLAFLFKILKPNLKKDIAVVLKRIIPLLSEEHPQYINNFAAESFAFVARDIRDKKKFLELLLNYLKTNDDAITGCGHLLFEMIKGVGNKFHSCIDTFLPLLLQTLKDDKQYQDVLFKVLTQTIEDSLQTISHKEYTIFWSSALRFIEEILNENDEESKGLEYILRLAGQVVEHQNGKYLTNPPQFVLLLVKVICEQFSENVLEVCAQIGALLLLSPNVSLSQEHAGIIVKVLLPLPYPNILINFVRNVIDYAQFDMHILPPFLNFVLQSGFDNEAMCTLTKICLRKSPLSMNGIKLFEWVKYPVDFGAGLPDFMEHCNTVLNDDMENIVENPSKLMNVLFCLPHIENKDVDYCVTTLSKLIAKLLQVLNTYNIAVQSENNQFHCDNTALSRCARQVLFILANALESAIHISSCKKLKTICDIEMLLCVILPYAADPNYLAALHLLDLYLTAYEQENGLIYAHLSLIDSYLRNNVSSPFHIVRLLTTHVYKLFENVPELEKTAQVGGSVERFSIFSRCFAVESIQPSIQEYRAQINMLQKMTFNTTQYTLAKETDFHLFALNYMLGFLYVNFKLLWEPVSEFIAGYGNALTAEEFWPPFYKTLTISFENAKKDLKKFQFDSEIDTNYSFLRQLYTEYNSIFERPDVYNYRNLILKVMTNCVQVCEAKNRDVVVLFLNFIEGEYRRNDGGNALKIDVEVRNNTAMEVDESAIENAANAEDIPEVIEEPKETASGKIIFKTLINIMQVLAQFKNPRALHKEPVFWELYMEFLKHKNAGLQKFALDCVLNYKNKSVTPYKSNLYNLVDENKFKDELTLFKITEDSQNIQPDDRQHVVPIILRILYGKMTSKLGADKKGGGQARRSLVMRYLAGCNENELKMFIEMAFSHLQQQLTLEPRQILENTMATLDLKSITSPGKLHSILNLFEVVKEYFGGYLKDDLQNQFFKIFYSVCSLVGAVLSQGDRVHVGYVKIMKNLRTLCLGTLRKLFDQFHEYPWSNDELYVIYETLIWPLIPKLHIEGIHTPTALLKLLNIWCQNPRYYVLLVTVSEKDNTLCPLPALFQLLLAPKTTPGVVNTILDMIEKLLTLAEDNEEKEVPPIESFNVLPTTDSKSIENVKEINFGSIILIPHIPSILEVMKRRIANSAKSNTVNRRDLLILSRVTELVTTPELCDDLLNLLLPILVKKVCMNMAEENMEHAVTTIINLLGHSTNPQIYIKNIAVLFNKVAPVDVRKLLIKLLSSIAENADKNKDVLTRMASIITEMNAYNKRWIEQPDFDRRIDAYKKIYQLSENNEIDLDLAILIVNNCFYSIRTEKDIGLRDGAGLCLKRILPKLLSKYWSMTDGQFLVRDTVLSLISSGIRDTKNEILRNESIALLGELARESPDADVVLSDLAHLTNKEDIEVDFFENMCHLQMHRRVRALMKFCKVAKKVSKCPTPRTLTNFILPLATTYICDDKYTDKNTLIDACIEVISTSCRLLPWYHYEVILKTYLNKMRHSTEHQKQLTRILVGILDAFHFDFSKVKNIDLPKALITNTETGTIKLGRKKAKIEQNADTSENAEVVEKKTETDDVEIKENETPEEDKVEIDVESELKAADDEAEKDDSSKEVSDVPAFERITSVSPSVAKRIIKSLSAGLLPQLNRAIGKMTDHEESHKVNRRRTGIERQEEEMMRVPIALALVKLLQRLPGEPLRHQLPGIIIKLCSFLKSPLKQVRIAARDIVKKIMITVGSSYLGILLEHLTLLLTKGFQCHVLVSTIHTVLDALKSDFKAGELNENLDYILDVCTNDLFGDLSEEKEVDKLHYKTPEAKPSKKSYVTLMIVSQNITEGCLINLLLPFKEVLQKHHSKKMVLKVQEALMHISSGLVTNKFIDIESLFIFLHGIASESIPEFVLGAPKREITEAQKEKMLRAKPDCFIIPETPKRSKESQVRNVKTSGKANSHVLVEFSMNILYVILKREKVPRMDCKAFVDPLIPLLVDALKSDHVKVTTVAMKCILTLWTIRISTPTLEEMIQDVVKTIFSILHKYATFEISKQNDNYHLVRNAFKAVTVLIRNVKYYKLEAEQLKTLLLYAEEDCMNDERQANSFTLLKAILEAKLVSTELHEVMEKISKICILSESAKSREEARTIFVTYLTNYSPGKKMDKFIQFFVSQLNFELQHGRESSLKFLDMIINKFPVQQLSKHGDYLLLALGASMLNDSAPECRAAAAACLEAMLKRLPTLDRNKLFDLVLTFFQDTQPIHFELAAQLSTRFVNVEGDDFKSRLSTVLSLVSSKILLLSNDITEGRFVKLRLEQSDDKTDEEKQKEKDHSLIQILNLIDRITTNCSNSIKDKKFISDFDDLAQQCQALLGYPHAWVRLRAAKILGTILCAVNVEELDLVVQKKAESERGFIYYDTEVSLRSLVLDLCAQFTPSVTKEMAEEVTSVLFQILKLVHNMSSFKLTPKCIAEESKEEAETTAKVNLRWILFKLRKAVNVEVARAPNSTNIRISIFTMWTHLISSLETDDLNKIIDVILPPIVRELSVGDVGAPASPVKQLAGRLGKKLRRKIGDIEYGKLVAEVQTRLNIRRVERKKVLLQEKVHNPEKAAKRKLQLKEKKKQAKKMKLEMMHGKRPKAKKRKAEDIDVEDQLLQDDD